ncbi:IS110 family transposase [Pseudoalteromonas aurantia]|uniref:IS110 family transposase n=2 Tax=Pseudoalteromonas TaxID=53246 RepID=A0A5S3V1Z3_9GAMM|nr:IS110 family transposase [Pseudoalteromonas aurantia]TMO64575.1 IS110 family transposase [Pseudoalteromonas aurantia]
MNQIKECVVGGVDTHKDIHVAAVVNEFNQVISTESFPTTRYGYKKMLMWMSSFVRVSRVGIEFSGTYGLGLLRYMQSSGIDVLEVTAPDNSDRRRRGKDDTLDAENAAHAAFSKLRTVTPKTRDGMVESLRVLKSCRKSAVAARTVALQMIRTSIVSAPDELRETLRYMTRMSLIRTLASTRPDLTNYKDISTAYRITLKSLARRYIELHDEIADLDKMIATIVDTLAPELIKQNAVGYESAAQLLITLGDNPERLKSESSFAALCGVCPIPASSGKTNRHRLNRGGDRAANSALHIIAIGRLRTEDRSKSYIKKRTADGLSKMEALRCLKRYIARELYYLLKNRNTSINCVQITC